MHELALAQDIVAVICEKVTGDPSKITRINIDLGTFSGAVAESLEWGLKITMEEKNAPGAAININRIAAVARCECGEEYQLDDILETCSKCGSINRELVSGMDIVINSVEIAED